MANERRQSLTLSLWLRECDHHGIQAMSTETTNPATPENKFRWKASLKL